VLSRVVLVLAVLCSPALVHAQTSFAGAFAPSPSPAAPPSPPPRLEGSGEFGFVATSGNASTQSIGLSGEIFYRPAEWVLQGKVAFVRQESDRELQAKSFTTLVRAARDLSPRLAVYGQYDFLRDLFAGIEQRHSETAGLAYKLIVSDRQALTVRGGVGVATERRVLDAGGTDGTATQTVLYVLKVSDTSQVTNDFHLEESLAAARDRRMGNEVALSTRINRIFSLKVSNTLRFVNDPVPGFKTTDTITSVALVAKF
jgi:putative salt-induced outer membrane protein YdiY